MMIALHKQRPTGPIAAAAYVRMSSDRQEDSPARQKEEIKRLAERDGYQVVAWYEDHGKTGTKSKNRPNFQRMLKDAEGGGFQAILVHEQSRFSREHLFDVMLHWKTMFDAGVSLVTTRRGAINFEDTGSVISGVLDVLGAREESVKIADRCVGGLRIAIEHRGQRLGSVPFGFDREVIDEHGAVVKVVSFREHFGKPRSWRTRLVPTAETAAIEVVQFIFQSVIDGLTVRQIAVALNKRCVHCPPKAHPFWTGNSIKVMLKNPIYCGDYRYGHRSSAQFSRVVEEITVKQDMHEGLIDRKTFLKVQGILQLRYKPPGKTVAGRNLFVGMARCAHCGNVLRTMHQRHSQSYGCSAFGKVAGEDFCCYPIVKKQWLESAVLAVISKCLRGERVIDSLNKAAARRSGQKKQADPTAAQRRRLAEVRTAIQKATRNIALADDAATIRNINAMIRDWRAEETELEKTLSTVAAQVTVAPEAKLSILDLASRLERLKQADRAKLTQFLQFIVKAIRLGQESRQQRCVRRVYAEVEFLPGVCGEGPVTVRIPHEDICPKRRYQAVTDYVLARYPKAYLASELTHLPVLANLATKHRRIEAAWTELHHAIRWGLVRQTEDGRFQACAPR